MTPSILGRKVGMTQIYLEDGRVMPVTVIQAGPCHVLQVRSQERDGYEAVQLGFEGYHPHLARVRKSYLHQYQKNKISVI